jgi:protein-tyrosine phosphatase
MKVNSFYAAPLLLAVSAAPALAQEVITTPILTSVNNFRDIAGVAVQDGGSGVAYSTAHGGEMRTGVFYRSNALSGLSDADKATLSTLGITEDIDLRTTFEINGAPEEQKLPSSIPYVRVDIFGTNAPASPDLSSPATAEAYLEAMNRGFVTNASERAQFATVFADLANGTGPMMYNCTSGKDRTGWTSAILESIAGMSSADIMANYLATDAYSGATINALGGNSTAIGTILSVQQPDLQAGLDQIIASYGSLDNYLKQGLGMSQAEIYVLRAKMVYYATLPGQDPEFWGNSAAGAELLNELQNSKLSGAFTAYNYYLQSSIDAGTLGDVPSQVGGQVVPDTTSYLARLPQLTNASIAPYISGAGMNDGQTKIWESNLAGVLSTDSNADVADSNSHSAGLLVGATHRFNDQVSIDAGVGYDWGTVSAAEGNTQSNVFLTTVGARYAFSSLESGPYVSGGGNADVVSVHDNRALGGGLGNAIGNTNGAVYDLHAEIGNVIPTAAATFTPQLQFDVANAHLNGFTEQGSELSLQYSRQNIIVPSLTASVEAALPARAVGEWSITPVATLGYVRLLSTPVVTSHGTAYGYTITQISAFNSRDLGTLAIDVSAVRGPLSLDAGVTGVIGDANSSTGIAGRLAVTYRF